MARIYATAAEVHEYDESVPADSVTEAQLRTASLDVDRLTRNARYTTGPDGMPTDAGVLAALRDAVCAQIVWGHATGADDPSAANLASLSLGSASFTFKAGTGDAAADAVTARRSPDAVAILRTAGLMNPGVRVR